MTEKNTSSTVDCYNYNFTEQWLRRDFAPGLEGDTVCMFTKSGRNHTNCYIINRKSENTAKLMYMHNL